jgi:hypothetical protein
MKKYLLALDLSTNSTGWALFNTESKVLVEFGVLKPSLKGISKLVYPKLQLMKIKAFSAEVADLVKRFKNDLQSIVVEEINMGRNRMGQKTLDAFHFFVMDALGGMIDLVVYRDSDGADGWRRQLGHLLTDADKEKNKQARLDNKKLRQKDQIVILTKKHVTARWVNKKFNKNFNIDENASDNDICDAIGLGWAGLEKLTANQGLMRD